MRQSLGYAPQAVDLPDDLTAREFALHIASLKGLDQAAADKQFGRITGLLYRLHIARRHWRITAAFARWFSAGPTPAVIADAPAARRAGLLLVGLVVAEFRLIGAGKLFLALAALVAAFGMIGEYRHAGSPAAMLLLIFGMTAHAGRSEARKLLTLSNVAPLGPMLRRASSSSSAGIFTCRPEPPTCGSACRSPPSRLP